MNEEDQLGDDDWISIAAGLAESAEAPRGPAVPSTGQSASAFPPGVSGSRKLLMECYCKLVLVNEVVEGRFELCSDRIRFHGQSESLDNFDEEGANVVLMIFQLREVHLRRYNLRRSAIELFLTDQTSFFFNFDTKTRNKVYSKILSTRPPNLLYSKQRSPADLLRNSVLTQRWVNREISNFEYLMQLNTIAGRTYNDLSQYPVFPWILADYTSSTLDLNDPKTFRDLSKPIGVVNPKNEREVKEKYDSFEDPNGVIKKFHYGTHYSSGAGVMHYLVRMEPYTSMHINLQSGKFDVADRQFYSIPLSWNFIMESPNDNKELIPEFFYQPQFLRNENQFDFGRLQQSEISIDNVELPPWASSPEDFIRHHRMALESEFVSQHLHHWIDLIFGYKQKGPEAAKALNVFYYVTYEGCVDLDQISDPYERESLESMINNFGQTPCQLLKTPHPRRLSSLEMRQQMVRLDKCLPVLLNLSQLRHSSKFVCALPSPSASPTTAAASSDPLCFLHVPQLHQRSFIGSPDRAVAMITVYSSNIVAKHTWYPSTKLSATAPFQLDLDPVFESSTLRRKRHIGLRHGDVAATNELYAVSPDGRLLVAGGDLEGKLVLMTLTGRRSMETVVRVTTPHGGPISCVALDVDCGGSMTTSTGDPSNGGGNGSGDGPYIMPVLPSNGAGLETSQLLGVTGATDGSVVLWHLCPDGAEVRHVMMGGCYGRCRSVGLSSYLDLVVMATVEAVCIWSATRATLLHIIRPPLLGSVSRALLSREGHIYIVTEAGKQNWLFLYSLRPPTSSGAMTTPIATVPMDNAPVTTMLLVSDTTLLLGTTDGSLHFLESSSLVENTALRFEHGITHAQLASASGQHLLVALANGSVILSTVSPFPSSQIPVSAD